MSRNKHQNRNLAARMGRWSAAHWKTATFGWLALVVVAFGLGGQIGTNIVFGLGFVEVCFCFAVGIDKVCPTEGFSGDSDLLEGQIMFEAGDADFGDIECQWAGFFAWRRGELLALGGDSPERKGGHRSANGSTTYEACLLQAKQTVVNGAAVSDVHDLAEKRLSGINGRAEKREHVHGFAAALLISDVAWKQGHSI